MNPSRIKSLHRNMVQAEKDFRAEIEPLVAGLLPATYTDPASKCDWDARVVDSVLLVWGVLGGNKHTLTEIVDLDAMIESEKVRRNTCPKCGGPCVKSTKSIPIKRWCAEDHSWIADPR